MATGAKYGTGKDKKLYCNYSKFSHAKLLEIIAEYSDIIQALRNSLKNANKFKDSQRTRYTDPIMLTFIMVAIAKKMPNTLFKKPEYLYAQAAVLMFLKTNSIIRTNEFESTRFGKFLFHKRRIIAAVLRRLEAHGYVQFWKSWRNINRYQLTEKGRALAIDISEQIEYYTHPKKIDYDDLRSKLSTPKTTTIKPNFKWRPPNKEAEVLQNRNPEDI